MASAKPPLVSIGLPVFNGERYVAEAIDSILGQTLGDLELVICDNASTDRTGEICRGYARRDARVRYHCNGRNLGAGPNYNLCFERSRGRYFKWAAHDDALAPEYLEKAVALLERHPAAVLCCVGITEIGPGGEVIRTYVNDMPGIEAPAAPARLAAAILSPHECEDFFGLFRREALVGSGLHGTYTGSDRVLLAEMALRGPWVKLPEPLFLHREHGGRYTRAVLPADRRQAAIWQDTSGATAPSLQFHLGVYRRYWLVVARNVGNPWLRWACRAQLVRWWFVGYHLPDVIKDFLRQGNPRLLALARRLKRAVGREKRLPPDCLTNS